MNIDKFIEDVKSIENEPNKFIVFYRDDGYATTMLLGGNKITITKDDVWEHGNEVYVLSTTNGIMIIFDKYRVVNKNERV